jgi:hypothetical protein
MAAEPGERLAEALRARATGVGQQPGGARRVQAEAAPGGMRAATALLIAFVVGALLGTALALVALLAPGVLPGTA